MFGSLMSSLALGAVLGLSQPPTVNVVPSPYGAVGGAADALGQRCQTAVTWSVQGGIDVQRALVGTEVEQVAQASGQRYTQVAGGTPAALTVIIWNSRAQSRFLSIDGTADDGYTRWTPGAAGIDLLISRVQAPLVLHELMLSRHIVEEPDPGGLLGHTYDPQVKAYSAADLAMLAATPCL